MTRLFRLRQVGIALIVLSAGAYFSNTVLPRWFPTVFSGVWGALGAPDNRNVPAALRDLPVVLIDGKNEGGPIAVLISGNGGWWGIDDGIASGLARAGVTTIGLNSLAYFIHHRSPDEVAVAVERMVAPFRADRPIILVGYSFGADVAATVYAHLTPELRERIHLVSLLGLSREADYAVGFMKVLSAQRRTIPAVAAISGPHVQCFRGADEGDRSGCSDVDPQRVEIVTLPGGHHFDGNYDAIASRILEGLPDPHGGDDRIRYAGSNQIAMAMP
ncbi:AcvB/VirJ family lysyl-phosphatidylglycerol hydrolase [Labrys monachus]|uniref:Type IV secretory pathway VirJ component n=1 Tax=Labrys monachus TaxID=217067 RepID=A0ABU0FMX0_9HYPH|nr:AcvB/VirJ family lysyl-phosphatidylglycerol hydrolase [Labrys monachus]MDQ0395962.1 type IV secretory pathway VirJ component [Labrys monachus]